MIAFDLSFPYHVHDFDSRDSFFGSFERLESQHFERFFWISLLSYMFDFQDSYIYKYLKKYDVMPISALKPYEKEEVMICLLQNPLPGKRYENMLQLTNEINSMIMAKQSSSGMMGI